jgi:hypothetical protein
MSNPFDYVNAISQTKENMVRNTENDELAIKGYNPFLTNKSLSYHIDTIGVANEMNMRHDADARMQFEYLLNSVRPKKRFAKWVKRVEDEDISSIKEYYGYNDVKAEQALSILTPQQLELIKQKLSKGGKN